MRLKEIFGVVMLLGLLTPAGFSVSKPVKEMVTRGGPDIVAADEQPARYPALDLEDLCKHAKNPKCEAVVDSFCIKSCNAKLCSKYGSIRGMCRLMCEAEDLLPECSQMRPPKPINTIPHPQPPFPYYYPQG